MLSFDLLDVSIKIQKISNIKPTKVEQSDHVISVGPTTSIN